MHYNRDASTGETDAVLVLVRRVFSHEAALEGRERLCFLG